MTLELWGGLECTVNRVRDIYSDQVVRTGHEFRVSDLDLFADLGIRKLRYPVLWERTAPNGIPDWRWPDERLNRLPELKIEPIVGLLHHGSGPRFTNLLDDNFPQLFSEYARAVAERYPWIELYTPINEPLTTARFSCLYGFWYPHHANAPSFARALLLQLKATVLAMREIRAVNPRARLIQTEDPGKTFSSERLAYQADFENSRRWVTWDLLAGRLDSKTPMWEYLRWAGATEKELFWFRENSCPPDTLGINHYVTSDRYLDENFAAYPAAAQGGNGRDRYADVEAVRTVQSMDLGPEARIAEAWQRFNRPIAITEAHLGCADPGEQMRWFCDVWEAAQSQQVAGADIRAVTAWSLLGAFDWNSLVTEHRDIYERGVFELRNGVTHSTEFASMLKRIGRSGTSQAHKLTLPLDGWWRRPERIRYVPSMASNARPEG